MPGHPLLPQPTCTCTLTCPTPAPAPPRTHRRRRHRQFIIATIPTVLGVNESARLIRALRAEQIPCRRIVVNQIIAPGMGAK